MNIKELWTYVSSMWLYIRLVLFEKYGFFMTLMLWVTTFVVAFILHGLYQGLGLLIVILAFAFQKKFYHYMESKKAALLRKGDRVEFAEGEEEGYVQKFNSGKILERMRGEDVLLTTLFDGELVPFYSHFYLIEMEDKNTIIPYEWILSIDTTELGIVD